jgi:hypothetical protein
MLYLKKKEEKREKKERGLCDASGKPTVLNLHFAQFFHSKGAHSSKQLRIEALRSRRRCCGHSTGDLFADVPNN